MAISSYRLGDLVILELDEKEKEKILKEHPNSLGSKYIVEKKKNKNINNFALFTKIVMRNVSPFFSILPNDVDDSTVIHLRLGDVVGGNEWHEVLKRPLGIPHLQKVLKNDKNKKYVIGKCFFAETSSRNHEECIKLSEDYLKKVCHALGAEHFDSGSADLDLFFAVKSRLFVQGKGFFSKLIVEVRKCLRLPCIETTAYN
jgi:hypothetical protein